VGKPFFPRYQLPPPDTLLLQLCKFASPAPGPLAFFFLDSLPQRNTPVPFPCFHKVILLSWKPFWPDSSKEGHPWRGFASESFLPPFWVVWEVFLRRPPLRVNGAGPVSPRVPALGMDATSITKATFHFFQGKRVFFRDSL